MPEKKKKSLIIAYALTVLKYVFSAAFLVLVFSKTGSGRLLLCTALELACIVFLSDCLKNKIVRYAVNGILMLLLNSQLLVSFFGGSFISMVMLTNIDNARDLSGNAVLYILGIILVLVFSFLPAAEITGRPLTASRILSAVLCAELVFTMNYGSAYSAFYAYWALAKEARETAQLRKALAQVENVTAAFYRNGISCNTVEKVQTFGDTPNIILILTEGLSQNVVSDERGIMPNVAEYEKKSIFFSNYYDHTFATYRGIIGQLYSGYQLDNYDTNTLTGIQDILADHGYHSTFISTEPNLVPFANYLSSMNFEEVVNDAGSEWTGPSNSMTDKEAFEKLFSVIEEQSAAGQPFFTVIYTFGTHASFDSPDEKFGDGSLAELNKFYNADCQFGQFMEKFENSPVSENTIVVYTADHAAYADLYYNEAFPDYVREHVSLDQVPLFIYHKGVEPQMIDVKGRNSLDLTSTILDYIDIDGPNYFLGASLFHDEDNYNNLDTIYTNTGSEYYSTKGGTIRKLKEDEVEYSIVSEMVKNYFAAKTQEPMTF